MDDLHHKMIKIPIVDHDKKQIGFDLWNIGCYNENDKRYTYTVNNNKQEHTIKALKLIKTIKKNKWKVYNHFVTRAVAPEQYLQLIARDKVKRKYFYNNPNEADKNVCHLYQLQCKYNFKKNCFVLCCVL